MNCQEKLSKLGGGDPGDGKPIGPPPNPPGGGGGGRYE